LEAGSLAWRQPQRVGQKNIAYSRLDEYFCFTNRGEGYPASAILLLQLCYLWNLVGLGMGSRLNCLLLGPGPVVL